jgi:membrane-associated PAP2 superfamily phosphatase
MASAKNILTTALILLGAILFFGLSPTDIWVQTHFYNPLTHGWMVDSTDSVFKFIFYDGIKRLLIIVAILFLLALIAGWKQAWMKPYRRGVMVVVLSSIFAPLSVGSLKAITNMPCPKNLEIFNGTYPHTCVWEKYGSEFCQQEKQKCWPAGHASGGFALLSLIFLFHSRKNKIAAASVAMVIGWSMGMYKMLIGDHFLSHSVITMILAWLIVLLIVRLVDSVGERYLHTKMV